MELHKNIRMSVILLLIIPLVLTPPISAGNGEPDYYKGAFFYKNGDTGEEYVWYNYLTAEQGAELLELKEQYPDITIVGAFTIVAPDQLATMPEPMRHAFENLPLYGNPDFPYYTHDLINNVWTDPCGTIVPESDVPRNIYPGDSPGVALYHEWPGSKTYTSEVQEHLANLGLATDQVSLDPEFSTSVQDGAYIVTFQANTLQGERVSLTLIHKSDGSWTDAATGEEISYDLHYVLAAFYFATSPDYVSPFVQSEIAAKASSVGTIGSFDVAAQSKNVSSSSSTTLANTLLSQAGTSKISKVNISSFAATRATTTPTGSTASLVPQDAVSSSGETPEGGNFDVASFAASYRSGGTTIASNGFGLDVLAARGIGRY
jgi:hypothetical protein